MLAGEAPIRALVAARVGTVLAPAVVRALCHAQGAVGISVLVDHVAGPTEADGAFYDEKGPAKLD
jgi:hypothetical protein